MSRATELVRVRGQVQGVGFRPTVARIASQLGLSGWVKNDADGVLIALAADIELRDHFVDVLLRTLPPLARVRELLREPLPEGTSANISDGRFVILATDTDTNAAQDHRPTAQAVPDVATCEACAAEVLDPGALRYRYPFTNCTHCGPRFSIMLGLPWDRARTSMAVFAMCGECHSQYADPLDRRYHAEPIACPRCGPRLQLARSDGDAKHLDALRELDVLDAIASLLLRGDIVALKGLGGYHLLADATQEPAVARLRSLKRRPHKPFALMARDLEVVNAYCVLSQTERASLLDPSAPIVLLRARSPALGPALARALCPLPAAATPNYGFMLPMTPLHALALRKVARPMVCTSGNRSEEPPVVDDTEAFERLGGIADWIVSHDRTIYNRVDDSVVRVFGGERRVLRRARGLAPAPLPLPAGFAEVSAREAIWAAGADLKSAICMSRKSDLLLSQHLGDLDDALCYVQYRGQAERLSTLFGHRPTCIALDNHPDGRAAAHARSLACELGVPSTEVAHHHAHFAACLGDNAVAWDGRLRLGLVLDGIGKGDAPDALWGCELFVGDYAYVQRLGTLLPTALLGGDRAAREPWRCLYAQLRATYSWQALETQYGQIACVAQLRERPLPLLEQLLQHEIGTPRASSCGRLFDAVAAALDICFEQQTYEAQAAQTLEAVVEPASLRRAVAERATHGGYTLPVHSCPTTSLLQVDPRALWPPLLADLARRVPTPLLAARFHVALAGALARMCAEATDNLERAGRTPERVVALSGGCLQNAVLHERLQAELEALGFAVLSHVSVPANDGGIALGQALVTLARRAQDL